MALSHYIIRCPSCRAKNRIPAEKAGAIARCGKCKNEVPTNEITVNRPMLVTDGDFQQKVLNARLPVVLYAWAPWCGPCQSIGPMISYLAGAWAGRALIGKLNVDQNPLVSNRFDIMSVPMFFLFDNGRLVDHVAGALPQPQLEQWATRHFYV